MDTRHARKSLSHLYLSNDGRNHSVSVPKSAGFNSSSSHSSLLSSGIHLRTKPNSCLRSITASASSSGAIVSGSESIESFHCRRGKSLPLQSLMHEESSSRRKTDEDIQEGAVPAYLLDRENTSRAKVRFLFQS